MKAESDININDIDTIDIEAIPLPDDKVNECEYFFNLLAVQSDVKQFRWLVSAFLNSTYSFFEILALNKCNAFYTESGAPVEDDEGLKVLRTYVNVFQNKNNPDFVKTSGHNDLLVKLYEIRKRNTHHYPLSIMKVGNNYPEDFYFGYKKEESFPALKFCSDTMNLINMVNKDL